MNLAETVRIGIVHFRKTSMKPQLSRIAFITSDRSQALARALESYAESLGDDYPDLCFTVLDNSHFPGSSSQNRETVVRVSKRHHLPMHCIGVPERERFVNELVELDFPEKTVRFACCHSIRAFEPLGPTEMPACWRKPGNYFFVSMMTQNVRRFRPPAG